MFWEINVRNSIPDFCDKIYSYKVRLCIYNIFNAELSWNNGVNIMQNQKCNKCLRIVRVNK